MPRVSAHFGQVFYTKISHARKPETGVFLGHRDVPVANTLGFVLTLGSKQLMYQRQGGHGIDPVKTGGVNFYIVFG